MLNWFNTRDCFLKIAEMNKGLNIYFTNDEFYHLLRKYNLLPISKIKRLLYY